MPDSVEKSERELNVFEDFSRRSPLTINHCSIKKCHHPEPDILCRLSNGETVAFELKELCEKEVAKTMAYLSKSRDQEAKYIRGGSSEEVIMHGTLRKQYKTDHPIELLFYTDGRIAQAPDVLICKIQQIYGSYCHPFRRVWFMGDNNEPCKCVVSLMDFNEF